MANVQYFNNTSSDFKQNPVDTSSFPIQKLPNRLMKRFGLWR